MTFWNLKETDIDRIALGVGILGTGGGGNPYLASLMAKAQLLQGREIKMVRPADLAPDAMVLALGGIGAPTVGIEKIEEGDEGVRVLHAMERLIGRRIDAVMADEIGGGNGIAPMITAAKLGLPVVDADGMGRAFPEVQMTTFFINGQSTAPTALADASGNVVIVSQATSPEMLEKLMRAGTVAMGCTAHMGTAPMSGDFVRRFGVPHTVSQSWRLGDTVLNARAKKTNPVAAVLEQEGGALLLQGKVVDIGRKIEGGFVRGRLTVAGLGTFSGRLLEVDIQNEYLVAREEGKILSMVPDLICIMDSETGRPVSTEEQRYGLRVSVIAIPSPSLLRTELALASVGPRAFGYDFDFVPRGQPTVARPVEAYGLQK
ncbi:DUF917 family protein [Pararhizobium capsulatum DSM 1112]|uniref:DUF917 family protein n=1 Tax=Pararhizobium capsulatum DSM 1112 TaxID=1121113 RepID=A0ABU0BVN5_9HYPH|nr:DUF917 domain-containing protein [Pararhizobium capsulatum]MDQ0322028.1 DUF917 family protein [Pararhizobium capsulatum DSM 1112]